MKSRMLKFLHDIGNYDSRVVERTEVNGLVVSTAFTSDEGYETAILDMNGNYPVERYANRDESEKGHWKWCEVAKDAKTIVMLGAWDLVEGAVINLVRK